MQDSLFPIGIKDVEAIAKTRANRTLPKDIQYYMYIGIVVSVIGVVICFWEKILVGACIALVGLVLLWLGTIKASNRRNKIARQYKQDWREAQTKESRF